MVMYEIEGIHCGSCVKKIETAMKEEGVEDASLNLSARRLSIGQLPVGGRSRIDAILSKAGDYAIKLEEDSAQVDAQSQPPSNLKSTQSELKRLYPLGLVVGFVATATAIVSVGQSLAMAEAMSYFMGGMFLAFAFFKLLDLKGFVTSFRKYDTISQVLPAWAWVYPFVELALGGLYLASALPMLTYFATIAIMSIGAIGVVRTLRSGKDIQCACLGTALNLPMTIVTFIENTVMSGMALYMLILHMS